MTSRYSSVRDEISALMQSVSLELALAQPGSQTGALEAAKLMSELASCVASCNEPNLVNLNHDLVPLIAELQQGAASWHDRHIEAFSAYLTKLEALLDDAGRSEGENLSQEASQESAEAAPEEESLLIDGSTDREFLREFCSEGRDLLQDIEKGVLILEQSPSHRETLNSIFRAFHTFKGGAGFLGLSPVKSLSHELESLLDAIRQGRIRADRESIDLILAGRDCLGKFVEAISRELEKGSGQEISIPTEWLKSRVVARLSSAEDGSQPLVPPSQSIVPEVPADREVPPTAGQLSARTTEGADPKPDAQSSVSHALVPLAVSQGTDPSSSIRIGLEKLDALVDLVAELVIAQSMVIEGAATGIDDSSPLSRDILVLRRITNELQHNAMSLRMVPVRGAFQKMQRLVRDLASQQGKVIHLKTSGEETEIDRNIVAQLTDPLIHMVRNACDHGIETPQERLDAGKPSSGVLSLSAFHQGGGIVIRVSDDGHGLDTERIRHKALERGIIQADAGLSRDDILKLIFAPGFSTAETITDLSGRGVGMDVVRGNIAKLRGRIEIDSALGAGTTFTIYLPLTLAIIQGMVVGVGKERIIIPSLAVRESFKPEPSMFTPLLGRGTVINRRGRLLPVIVLGEYLGVPSYHVDPWDGIAIIVESGTSQCCFIVDRLIGKSEVVIKELGGVFEAQKAMSGAAILGDGRVALIIDVDRMVNVATSVAKRQGEASRPPKPAPALIS